MNHLVLLTVECYYEMCHKACGCVTAFFRTCASSWIFSEISIQIYIYINDDKFLTRIKYTLPGYETTHYLSYSWRLRGTGKVVRTSFEGGHTVLGKLNAFVSPHKFEIRKQTPTEPSVQSTQMLAVICSSRDLRDAGRV